MHDWNVVISVHEHGFISACELLGELGPVSRTEFRNVLVMKVEDISSMMETLREWISKNPGILSFLARVVPVTHTFTFQLPEEFEAKAKEIVLGWVPRLAGKRFHVRMHRRGFKGKLSSVDEERFLDKILLEALEKAGTPGHITFEDPDAIIVIETIGQRAGLSFWTREDLQKYPFLRLD
ncbi:MAG TPA: THUMP domain-containing protein [Candidatus Limnocylindrales bacterium]|nr:THUMP domain-containing protein [Candidatus Limnocylindrales bacterium]